MKIIQSVLMDGQIYLFNQFSQGQKEYYNQNTNPLYSWNIFLQTSVSIKCLIQGQVIDTLFYIYLRGHDVQTGRRDKDFIMSGWLYNYLYCRNTHGYHQVMFRSMISLGLSRRSIISNRNANY